jgi:ubiquinone/menaquinone biosynthesis C-methylase UbiE
MRCITTLLLALFLHQVAMTQDGSVSPTKTATAIPESPVAKGNGASSVKPGINRNFIDPKMSVDEWITRFEVESREVYHSRREIMEALAIQPGTRIADVGAGTGFYTALMSEATGPTGWAYAIEISPQFTQHLTTLFAERGLKNTTTVFCNDRSICLPPDSIDLAFICDVYHHFEYPDQTMQSIHRALSEGGRVIVIDFERIPGTSREWTLGHVRAGKQTFIDEIQKSGFELLAERKIAGFKENYFLEFRKVPNTFPKD